MSQEWKNEPAADEEAQIPLGVGDGAPAEESYGEPSKPKINTSTLALFAAFAAALVVLYLLGLQNKPRAASAEQQAKQAAVNTAIEEMLRSGDKTAQVKSFLDDTNKLVELIRHYLEPRADGFDLPANPFERLSSGPNVVGPSDPSPILPTNNDEARELRKIAEEFSSLKLQSTMIGKNSAALINNRLVTAGAKVGSFTVSEIQSGRVLLNAAGKVFELKVDGPKMDRP
jgi:hypothetical protein